VSISISKKAPCEGGFLVFAAYTLTPALSLREREKGGSGRFLSPLPQGEGEGRVRKVFIPSPSGRGGRAGPEGFRPLSLRERGKGGAGRFSSPLPQGEG